MKSADKYNNTKFLFEKFIKPGIEFNPGRDIKLFNRMIKNHPLEFWKELDLGFKLNSLAFLVSEDGKKKIAEIESRTKKQKFIEDNRAGIKLVEENKFSQDLPADYRGTLRKDDGPNYELDNFSKKEESVEDTKIIQVKNKRMVDFLN